MRAPTPEHHDAGGGFSLVAGGPLHRLLRRLGLARDDTANVWRPAAAVLIVAWLPLLVLAVIERARTARWDALLADPSVSVRFWLAVPLLFAADRALHVRCRRTAERFVQSNLAGATTTDLVDRALHNAVRLRDRSSVELALLVAAVLSGQATLWGVSAETGFVRGVAEALDVTASRIWYATVSLPLYQYLFARWLWRWTIWSLVLRDLSRAALKLAPMHPDRAGGLGMLSDPTFAFALFAASGSSVLAAAWGAQMVRGGTALSAFAPEFAVIVLVLTALAFGPLLVFVPRMVQARFEGKRDYSLLVLQLTRLFRERWIEREPDPALLGTPDISALADLQSAYENMTQMRIAPFGPRAIATVALGVLVPMLPLALFEAPVGEMMLRIAKAMFVGLPG